MKINAGYIYGFLLVALLAGCTLTTTRIKPPDIGDEEALENELVRLVTAENIDLTGKELTTGNNKTSLLEITVTNAENIAQENAAKRQLGKLISNQVRSRLKDTAQYNSYSVIFVTKQEKSGLALSRSMTYDYTSGELIKPVLDIGKRLNSENDLVEGGTVFTGKDTEIICELNGFVFIDTSAVVVRILQNKNGTTEEIAGSDVDVNPGDNYLQHRMDVTVFLETYGAGKFIFQVLTNDIVITSKEFEVRQE